ncbi:MAG: ECF transporter S component [Oscillospiraceae bacterium]|nr:ECF transporter S component [Oscillospiraceae bacterium]
MENRKEHEKLRYLVRAGMFAALTALLTAALHIPVGSGYIHCGDAVIYLAAVSLPAPYAIGASAIGGMFADVLSGYPAYALPTFLIKGLLALAFAKCSGSSGGRQFLAAAVCGIISVIGYWVTAVILYGGWAAQFAATVPGNLIQAAASGIVYAVIVTAKQHADSAGPTAVV